jgi:hypothetical protein
MFLRVGYNRGEIMKRCFNGTALAVAIIKLLFLVIHLLNDISHADPY